MLGFFFVLVLFWDPTFPVGTNNVSLLLLCDMIQRRYLFLSFLWYSQTQSCLLSDCGPTVHGCTTVTGAHVCVLYFAPVSLRSADTC